MTDTYSDQYWQKDFDITQDDLSRIANRMREQKRSYTLTDLGKQVIRGRLEHGEDLSPAAISENQHVTMIRLWDPAGKWEKGDRAIILTRYVEGWIATGEMISRDEECVNFRVDGVPEIIHLKHAASGSNNATQWREKVRSEVEAREAKLKHIQEDDTLKTRTELILYKHGERVTSRLLAALQSDPRLLAFEDRWCLIETLTPFSDTHLFKLYCFVSDYSREFETSELLPALELSDSNDELLLLSLHYALMTDQHKRFENEGTPTNPRWRANPPPWSRAVGAYYVYDPDTYEILLEPNMPLKKKTAERLEALDWYADVVKPKDESETA